VRRGEIWWADLEEPTGSSPGYRRPVIVIQSDAFNRSRIGTVIVVVLTSNCRLIDAPGNVLVDRKQSGLLRDSVANVSQVVTLDRGYLSERVCKLPPRTMASIDAGLRLTLEL
jgi:mRNA interferase MazF